MEKLKKIIKQIQDIFSKIFYPILGSVCLSKEKRFSIEFDEKSIKICKISPNGKKILKIVEEKFDFDEKMPNQNICQLTYKHTDGQGDS